jgi:polysaccharide deacetylase family protein (PEP-CTERM system associated)
MRNALTIDVEDYYQVSAFDAPGKRDRWDTFESRVCRTTEHVLAMLDAASVRATFFVLGWVAERHPGLVRRIAAGGHEIASHGYFHQLVYDMTPGEFREDLRRAHGIIAGACGIEPRGYRAPSFSITARSLWALDVLAEEGYTFDSSIFPVRHDRYGMPDAPRAAHLIARPAGTLLEVPPSTVVLGRTTLPVAGGGYFRLYPYALTRAAMARLNQDGQPAVVYVHPWEFDPGQPRQAGSALSRFRHYVNLGRTGMRFRQLLREFSFAPLSEVGRDAVARQAGRAVDAAVMAPVVLAAPGVRGRS